LKSYSNKVYWWDICLRLIINLKKMKVLQYKNPKDLEILTKKCTKLKSEEDYKLANDSYL